MADTILIVDDEASIRNQMQGLLEEQGYNVILAKDDIDALDKLKGDLPDAIFLDLWMRGQDSAGFNVLDYVNDNSLNIPTIIITGVGNIDIAVKATKKGAFDFLVKPIEDVPKLLIILEKAVAFKKTIDKNTYLSQKLEVLESKISKDVLYVGTTKSMVNLMEKIKQVGPSDISVLITGENGVGKELVAQALHAHSSRSSMEMVSVNCAAIPDNLVESSLFGHEKGAFTGADKRQLGSFSLADKSTLFLDEIGDMTLLTQAKILKALETNSFQTVGGQKTIKVSVRVISATNKDLIKEIENGTFRNDLYFRLNHMHFHVPALRDRREDIPALSNIFLEKYLNASKLPKKTIAPEILAKLQSFDWPGNIRQLKHTIERLAILNKGNVIKDLLLDDEAYYIRTNHSGSQLLTNDNVKANSSSVYINKTEDKILNKGTYKNQIDDDPDIDSSSNITPEITNILQSCLSLPHKLAKKRFDYIYILFKMGQNDNSVLKTADKIGVDRTTVHKRLTDLKSNKAELKELESQGLKFNKNMLDKLDNDNDDKGDSV
jgi:two-component system nitrogen regulation response regulator NtrX